MLKSTSILALVAFIATVPTIAQTTVTQPTTQSTGQTQVLPADTAPVDTATPDTSSVAKQVTEDDIAAETENRPEITTQDVTSAEKTSLPVMGQIILQSERTILSNDFVGASVYSPNDEAVGDINDMIINLDGTVQGVVVGVGGFLGIGEKDVAVKMSAISVTLMKDGNVRLVLNSTKQELEAAPAFKSVAEQKVEEETEKARKAQQNIITNSVPPTELPKTETNSTQ